MQAFFLSGTDTDIGKTVVAAWIALHWQADYWKPVQSGLDGETDSQRVHRLSGCHTHPETYRLQAPLSPHQSAAREGLRLELDNFTLPCTRNKLVVEGAGGLMVPLAEKVLITDLITHLNLPVILVARSGLGTINHTVLSAKALKQNNTPCLGVVMVGERNPENLASIERYAGVPVLAELPWLDEVSMDTLKAIALPMKLAHVLKRMPTFEPPELPAPDPAMRLIERDRAHCWHPFTQAQTAHAPLPIVRGEGSFLFDVHGKRYLDAVSSWWVNLHGHANPVIAQAISHQAHQLEQVMFAGITHPPAIELAERLVKHAPGNLSHVFYSDNGSTAIEVALKMACQYWVNHEGHKNRNRFLAMRGGYHGDTFGAMSTGRSSHFYGPFENWLFKTDFLPTPEHWNQQSDSDVAAAEAQSLHCLDQHLNKHASQTVAFIMEPLVQGASGMRMMRASFVAQLVRRLKAAHIPVIFDEVMTGFGRTGRFFAADHVLLANEKNMKDDALAPDILCVSKGLTGGFMPMGATLAAPHIYEAFLSDDVNKALLHGHSYTANPLGCAAALANLRLLEREHVWNEIRSQVTTHGMELEKLAGHPAVEKTRQFGTIAAFDVKAGKLGGYGSQLSQWLRESLMQRGILMRPLGNTLYFIAPYCTHSHDLSLAYAEVVQVLDTLVARGGSENAGAELF
ncbi:MAG: adenosylmethionine--8-amino-7-oxononanoate transaminase [Burkholderiales bacterium]|nr:adenosylmethionine--8-amino-7-oxononanoate transaminase [Burkholderiales bacterium]